MRTLLKYSKIEARHPKIHSAIQAKICASPLSLAELASARKACSIATKKLPKQMEPKLVVTVRMKLELTADEQQPHSSGAYPVNSRSKSVGYKKKYQKQNEDEFIECIYQV